MSDSHSGGCLCGAIRFELTGDPLAMINCHCRDCQRASGGAYSPNVIVLAASLKVHGAPQSYAMTAESGNTIERRFCPICGGGLFGVSSGAPELIGVKAACFDDPSWYRPMADIWTASAQPWDLMHAGVPGFEKAPPKP